MHIRNALICILPLLILFLGCGFGSKVKKGERFEAIVDLREAANIQGSQEYSDGFTCHISKGTILEALDPINSPDFFECHPVVVNGNSDKYYIITTLVPEAALNKEGFESFSFTLPLDYIGTKLKRVN